MTMELNTESNFVEVLGLTSQRLDKTKALELFYAASECLNGFMIALLEYLEMVGIGLDDVILPGTFEGNYIALANTIRERMIEHKVADEVLGVYDKTVKSCISEFKNLLERYELSE